MSSAHAAKVLVVIPAYNEEATLADVIEEVRAHVTGCDVLVVDDGSSDRTVQRSREAGARVVKLPFNLGVGGALRAGLLVGEREQVRAVVQCDADGQHPADRIEALVAALADADIVVGARFAGEGAYHARGPRKWAMNALSWPLSRVHHTRLTDTTSGFRAFGPRAISVLSREMPPEYLGDTVETLVIAREHGLVVAQVPVAMRPRQGGEASQSPLRATTHLMRALLILVLSIGRLAMAPRSNR